MTTRLSFTVAAATVTGEFNFHPQQHIDINIPIIIYPNNPQWSSSTHADTRHLQCVSAHPSSACGPGGSYCRAGQTLQGHKLLLTPCPKLTDPHIHSSYDWPDEDTELSCKRQCCDQAQHPKSRRTIGPSSLLKMYPLRFDHSFTVTQREPSWRRLVCLESMAC